MGEEKTVKRNYKATLFAMIFKDKKELLALYNAVNGTEYDDPELLEINTLENAIYISMQNDVSFIIDSRLSLYEHQSTCNPNLPLRYLFYVSDLYAGMIEKRKLYGQKALRIPTPRFLIFYNGKDKCPERQVLKLSDLYAIKEEELSLELKAVMLNINPGCNPAIKDACKTLRDYSEYTARVRKYAKEMPLEDAVERTITECIQEGILAEFLSQNRAEAKKMSIFECDEEEIMRQIREDGYEEGEAAGRSIGRQQGEIIGRQQGEIIGRQQGEIIGRQQGEVIGMERLNCLIQLLAKEDRLEDIVKASEDPEYQKQLLEEFSV